MGKRPEQVKNYGIWLRYNSRTGTHNMYKEFRDVTLTAAVTKLYQDMAGRHRVRAHSIQIIRTAVVSGEEVRRFGTKQFVNSKIRFPLTHRVNTPLQKNKRSLFLANRPSTFQ